MSNALKEKPKDRQVEGELAARQLPLFEGFSVEKVAATIKASELKLMDGEVPAFNQSVYFIAKGTVTGVNHKNKKDTSSEKFTRIASVDVDDAIQIGFDDYQALIERISAD